MIKEIRKDKGRGPVHSMNRKKKEKKSSGEQSPQSSCFNDFALGSCS